MKNLLSHSLFYEGLQRALGVENQRKWLAKEHWRLRGDEKILDIGCGSGTALRSLPLNVKYIGLDLSAAYIDAAQKAFGHRGTFLVGDVRELLSNSPASLRNADLIICNGLLHHLDDDNAMEILRLSRNALKVGGRLVCLEPSFVKNQGRFSRWIMNRDRGKNIRTEESWNYLFSNVFGTVSTKVVRGLIRIPYVHVVIECTAKNQTHS